MDFATSFALVAPEILLSAAGLVLVIWTAWGGEKQARWISNLAALSLFGAGLLLIPTLHDGLIGPETAAFGDLFRADAFAAFAKASSLDRMIAKAFTGHLLVMIPSAAIVGAFSPFCSCGVIPLVAALLAMRVPLSAVMAFWLA